MAKRTLAKFDPEPRRMWMGVHITGKLYAHNIYQTRAQATQMITGGIRQPYWRVIPVMVTPIKQTRKAR